MEQQIEIEYKNLLTEQEFWLLVKAFQIEEKNFKEQKNHYFDTRDFALKKFGCALRIREKGNEFTFTMKEPHAEGLLETNEAIDGKLTQRAIEAGELPEGEIKNRIKKYGIDPRDIKYFGTLSTYRAEIPYKGGLLVFDKSFYFKKTDFELEYEVENAEQGKKAFFELLARYDIPFRKTENKILRFYREMKRQS